METYIDKEVVPERIMKSSLFPLRLLGQLDETEKAFDDFWERHRTKLEQCLQLRHFEKHFREVSGIMGRVVLQKQVRKCVLL